LSYYESGNNKGYLYRENQDEVTVSSQQITKSRGPVMASDKITADTYDRPLFRETDFKPAQTNGSAMKNTWPVSSSGGMRMAFYAPLIWSRVSLPMA
jgi:hypothetical protein